MLLFDSLSSPTEESSLQSGSVAVSDPVPRSKTVSALSIGLSVCLICSHGLSCSSLISATSR